MSRSHTFMDREFNRPDFDGEDQGDFEKNLVFVMMPLTGDNINEVYQTIKEECIKLGLKPKRIDEIHGSSFIIREITDLIERAEFLICDLTNERPSVYYELGYAHGVGNEAEDILLIAQQGTILHFDVAPLRVRYYINAEDLRTIISSELNEMIRVTRR